MSEQTVYTIRLNDQFTSKLDKAGKGLDNFEKKFGDMSNKLVKGFSALYIADKVLDFAKHISGLGAAAESTRISFQVLVGDIEKGNRLLGQLKNYANITPYLGKDILDSGKLLLAYGVKAEKIMPTIQNLGDIAAGDAQKLYSLSLAFGQMTAAGRLMGQDLLQMVNAGFNPLQVISQKTGISMGILKKKMEDGAISAKDVATAFKAATQEGGLFYKMTEKQSQTFGGKMSTLIDTLDVRLTEMGENLNRTLGPVLDKLLSVLDKTPKATKDLATYKDSRKSFNELNTLFDEYKGATDKAYKKSIEEMILSKFPTLGKDYSTGKPTGLNEATTGNMLEKLNRERNQSSMGLMDIDKQIASKWDEIEKLNKELSSGYRTDRSPFEKWANMGALSSDDYKNKMSDIDKIQKEITEMVSKYEEYRNERNPDKKANLEKVLGGLMGGKGKIGAAAFDLTGGKSKDKKKDSVDGDVRSGGTKNITINIQNLLKVDEFSTNNYKADEGKILELVKRSLLTALNDANLAVD